MNGVTMPFQTSPFGGASGSEPEPEEIYRRPAALEAQLWTSEWTSMEIGMTCAEQPDKSHETCLSKCHNV